MKIRLFVAALLLSLALPASADFKIISHAYEIGLSEFRAPATPSGGLAFKECAQCKTKSVRVTPSTQYVVNGRSVSLKEFKQATHEVRDRKAVAVIVLHHLESDTVVSVSVTI